MKKPAQRMVPSQGRFFAAVALWLLVAGAASAVQPERSRESTRWDEHTAAARQAEEREEWQAALGHHRRALGVADGFEAHDPRRLETLEALAGLRYWRLNQPAAALPYFQRAAAIREAAGRISGKPARKTWGALSSIYQSMQAWERAAWADALHVRSLEARWGEDSPKLIHHLTHLAWLTDQARPGDPEAEHHVLRAIGLVDTPERRGDAYASAGRYYLDRGRYEEAIDHLAEAIAAHEAAPSLNLEDLVALYGALGEAYAGAGQAALAEEAFATAVQLQEERLGPSHPYLVHPLYELGELLLAEGRPEEALPHLERAVALADAAWSRPKSGYVRQALARAFEALERPVPERARVAAGEGDDCCCGSGLPPEIQALREEGEVAGAAALARERALAAEAAHGAVSRKAADAWGDLGLLLWGLDTAGAADAYERQLEILGRLDGASPSEIAEAAGSAAVLASSLGQYERSETLRVLQVETLRSGSASASLAEALSDLGNARGRLGRHSEAAEDYRSAAQLWETLAGETSPEVLEARRSMAWKLIRGGRFAEAEEVLVTDLARLESSRSRQGQLALAGVLLALARVCEETGRDGEAQAMRERRLALLAEN